MGNRWGNSVRLYFGGLEKNVENPLDSKEIKLISPEGNQS